MNDKIIILVGELTALTGEETVIRELEGLIKKHLSLAHRKGRRNYVEEEAKLLLRIRALGGDITPRVVAERILVRSFGQASLYRLLKRLRTEGVLLKPSHVQREIERLKKGIC
ncbi:MAG: hypothetical protein QHG99_06610 [Methanomicrobiales archaeon]|nr:hypothetical protein [Methanomicrobiales archaeon]